MVDPKFTSRRSSAHKKSTFPPYCCKNNPSDTSGLQQPPLYATGSDQHLLTAFSFPGSLWRTMLLWDATPHLQFSIFSGKSTIMMAIDTSRCREVAVFDIRSRRQVTIPLCGPLLDGIPTKVEARTLMMVGFSAHGRQAGEQRSSGMRCAAA